MGSGGPPTRETFGPFIGSAPERDASWRLGTRPSRDETSAVCVYERTEFQPLLSTRGGDAGPESAFFARKRVERGLARAHRQCQFVPIDFRRSMTIRCELEQSVEGGWRMDGAYLY